MSRKSKIYAVEKVKIVEQYLNVSVFRQMARI